MIPFIRRWVPPVERTEGHYRQALGLAEELGMRPLIARCHLGLGQLYQRGGRHQQARTHLTSAATMFREMDMSFWLEKKEAELKKPGHSLSDPSP